MQVEDNGNDAGYQAALRRRNLWHLALAGDRLVPRRKHPDTGAGRPTSLRRSDNHNHSDDDNADDNDDDNTHDNARDPRELA